MAHRGFLFYLQILALWSSLAALAVVTSLAAITSSTRSDCFTSDTYSLNSTNITATSIACTNREHISTLVYHHSSYFQSAHIILIRVITTLSLLVFKPSLWAMAWAALDSSFNSVTGKGGTKMSLSTFQKGVGLVDYPGLLPGVLYVYGSRSVSPHVAFVVAVSLFSILSPVAVSPIYRSHLGPFEMLASVVNGGGVGPSVSPSFANDGMGQGVTAGRTLLNAGTLLNASIAPTVFDISVAPFIPREMVESIWSAEINTVVARNSLDCSSSAPKRISNSATGPVTVDPTYFFAPNQLPYGGIQPSFAGQVLGPINNDPQITSVYLNSSVKVAAGVVQADTSIIFFAANGTMEGAQQRITSPVPTSRIGFVDILVCTSTTKLETSICTIDQGNVTKCTFHQPTNSSTSTGGVEKYVNNPLAVATILSASPTTAYYSWLDRLPMYLITQPIIDSHTPPLSFLTLDTVNPPYHVPMAYTADVLFGETAQGLVQGMLTTWQTYADEQLSVISVFGTSKPELLYTILAICFGCAFAATFSSLVPRSSRLAAPLDISRILAISRNPQLDAVLQPYSDWNVEMQQEVMETEVGYGWVSGLNRRALTISAEHNAELIELKHPSDNGAGYYAPPLSQWGHQYEDIRGADDSKIA